MGTSFSQRAAADCAAVVTYVRDLLQIIGRPADSISVAEIEYFARNVRGIKALHMRSLADEHSTDTFDTASISCVFPSLPCLDVDG